MQKQTITTCFGSTSFTKPEKWSAHVRLPGFRELRDFILLDIERYRPFGWLHSIDDPQLCLALASPQNFGLHYPPVPGKSLFGHDTPNAVLLVMTAFDRDEHGELAPRPHAVAPLCFDPDSMRFVQWILANENSFQRKPIARGEATGKAARITLPAIVVQPAA